MDWSSLVRKLEVDSLLSFDVSEISGGFSVEHLVARGHNRDSPAVLEVRKIYAVVAYLTNRNEF